MQRRPRQKDNCLNGVSIGALLGDPYDKAKGFEIKPPLAAGSEARVVVRVSKKLYAAGINERVRVMVEAQ